MKIEIWFIIFSVLSLLSSLFVVLTALVFPDMRKRLFMQIVVLISFCNLVANSFSAFGFPPDDSVLCYLQSFFCFVFYKASWMWTTALAYQLYCICMFGKFGISMIRIHIIVWTISVVTTLLPLTTNTFGRPSNEIDVAWCFLAGDNEVMLAVWSFLSFVLVLLVSTFLIVYYLFRIYWQYRSMNIKRQYPEVFAILNALMLYPPGFVLTWGPNLLFALLANTQTVPISDDTQLSFNVLAILATQSGTVVAVIFFLKSREARFRWGRLLRALLPSLSLSLPMSLSSPTLHGDVNIASKYSCRQDNNNNNSHSSSSGLDGEEGEGEGEGGSSSDAGSLGPHHTSNRSNNSSLSGSRNHYHSHASNNSNNSNNSTGEFGLHLLHLSSSSSSAMPRDFDEDEVYEKRITARLLDPTHLLSGAAATTTSSASSRTYSASGSYGDDVSPTYSNTISNANIRVIDSRVKVVDTLSQCNPTDADVAEQREQERARESYSLAMDEGWSNYLEGEKSQPHNQWK